MAMQQMRVSDLERLLLEKLREDYILPEVVAEIIVYKNWCIADDYDTKKLSSISTRYKDMALKWEEITKKLTELRLNKSK